MAANLDIEMELTGEYTDAELLYVEQALRTFRDRVQEHTYIECGTVIVRELRMGMVGDREREL